MKERPILFSGPMVRALLNGSKTQTRRFVKARTDRNFGSRCVLQPHELAGEVNRGDYQNCPYGKPGDRLWVREAWRVIDLADVFAPREITAAHRIWFEADGPHEPPAGRYRPGMFMPRWASRILLEVTAVRVERLQDISNSDAIAEGVNVHPDHRHKPRESILSPMQGYRDLWESINGPDSWEDNPWVWVIEFKRI